MFVQAKHVAEDPGWQVGDKKNYIFGKLQNFCFLELRLQDACWRQGIRWTMKTTLSGSRVSSIALPCEQKTGKLLHWKIS